MENINSTSFLKIDGEAISIKQVLGYLQLTGRLQPFLQEIASQHVVYKEIQQRDDLDLTGAEIEQAALDFRIEKKLADSKSFEEWLSRNAMDYTTFRSRIVLGLSVDKLKAKIAEPDLEIYFKQRQRSLDRIDLSCLIGTERITIEQFKEKIVSADGSFDRVVKELSDRAEDKTEDNLEIMRGPNLRKNLPVELQEKVDEVKSGEVVGPLSFGQRWCLFQVERIVPATLDGAMKQEIENELFKQWLAKKVKQLELEFTFNS